MLLEPLLDGNHGPFVRLWRRVGPVKDANLLEEVDGYATAFSLGNLGAKPDEERFDVLPGDVRAGRVGKDGFEGLAMAALHGVIVPRAGTDVNSDA
jgi:hypothetical protein